MKAKKYMILLLLIIIFASTAACSGEDTKNKEGKAKAAKAEIKIDVMKHEEYLLGAIGEFNKTHNNISINYGDVVTYSEEYKNKYITSLAVGEGPDIIRLEPRLGLLSTVHKMDDSGIFYDLNNLINKDKKFKLSDYNQKVLDSGVMNGKRFFIPLGYDFRGFFAKSEVLEENGITAENQNWTIETLADEAYAYTQKNKETGKYFAASNGFTLSDIVKISGINFIDYEKKEVKFNSPEFIDLLSIYKKMYSVKTKSVTTFSGIISEDIYEINAICPDFDNGTALIMDNIVSSIWFNDSSKQNVNFYLFPQYTSKKSILLEPKLAFAINSNSKYVNEAYEFLKLLLSEEYQSISGAKRNFSYLPVNNYAYLNSVKFYISNLSDTNTGNDVYDAEKRKAQVKEQYEEIEKISVCDTVDAQVYDIIENEAKSFVKGKNTAKQTAKIIRDKVMLYLNE